MSVYYEPFGVGGVLAILACRILGFPRRISVRTKRMKHPVWVRLRTSDVDLYKSILLQGEYEYELNFSPRTIIDAGANSGMTAIFYANKYPGATIVAVEPEPSNFSALVKNVSSYPNVIPIHAALWHEDGQVEVFPPGPRKSKWGFRVRPGHGCRAVTMRTLMHEAGIESIDILKVDVEGAEREIFSNCDWMDRVKLLAIELHDQFRPGCSDTVNAMTHGFTKTERGTLTFYCR